MSRHPSTENLVRWFDASHLRPGVVQDVSEVVGELAGTLLTHLPDSPELTAGLRHLLEAKDCFVRAAIAAQDETIPSWTDR